MKILRGRRKERYNAERGDYDMGDTKAVAFYNKLIEYGKVHLESGTIQYRISLRLWNTGIVLPLYRSKRRPIFRNITALLIVFFIPMLLIAAILIGVLIAYALTIEHVVNQIKDLDKKLSLESVVGWFHIFSSMFGMATIIWLICKWL